MLARIGRHPLLVPAEAVGHGVNDGDDGRFRQVLEVLHASTGVDFSGYRESTLRRRVMRAVERWPTRHCGAAAHCRQRNGTRR